LLNFATLGFALGKYADVKPYLDQVREGQEGGGARRSSWNSLH
jgi:hypothetical protein